MTYDALVTSNQEISRSSITCREDSFEMHVLAKMMSIPNQKYGDLVHPSDHGVRAVDSLNGAEVSPRWHDATDNGMNRCCIVRLVSYEQLESPGRAQHRETYAEYRFSKKVGLTSERAYSHGPGPFKAAIMHLKQRTMSEKRSCRVSDSILGLESMSRRQADDRVRYAKMELRETGAGYGSAEVCLMLSSGP